VSGGELRALLRRFGISAGRRLGQHFLADGGILGRIAEAAEVPPGMPVLEVGPGVGGLTRELLRRGAEVTAVEVDRSLRPALLHVVAEFTHGAAAGGPEGAAEERLGPRLRVLWCDAVRLPWQRLVAEDPRPWWVCSNLPYYITGPFLASLLGGPLPWTVAVFLVQAEVADRLQAAPGGKAYGAFTCMVRYHAEVEQLFRVPRRAFLPPPAVDSVVIRLRRRPSPAVPVPAPQLMRVVRAAFAQRRKTLRNALAAGLALGREEVGAVLEAAGVAGERRAETLSLEEFGRIAAALAHGGAGR
jgi:16S rRNA (adenine1518-N6/adenine1519-N6)-dimethyltransferase